MADVWRERKVVTALFVDLAGFTSRSESRDPEDVEAELTRYQRRVRAELERFGGTVEKFIGDAVMAVFGAPVAHEDDAERAVRAALAVVAWAATDLGLDVRVGVNTGEALVRVGADAATGETLAIGDVVNTAARLQAAAETNGVLVGDGTFRATWLSEWEVIADFYAGAWDDVITGADRLLETMAAGGTHVLQVNQLPLRAKVRSAREWDFDPRPDLDTALDIARSAGAQPNLAGCLVWRADILLDLGASAEADVAFSEVLQLSPHIVWPENESVRFAFVAHRLGRTEDASAVLARSLERDWTAAARHILQREFGAAADLLT